MSWFARGRMTWMRWRNGSLRHRILGSTALVASIALVIALLAYLTVLNRVLFDAVGKAASDQARQVAVLVAQQPSAQAAIRDVPSQGSLLQLLDANNRVIASSDASVTRALTHARPALGKTVVHRVHGIPTNEDDRYVIAAFGVEPATHHGATTVVVVSPLRNESVLIRGATIALGILAGFMLIGVLWLINRAISSTLRSVERVRASVADIHATRDAVDVAVPRGEDEISRLAHTMNAMLARLRTSDATQRAFVSNASHELRSPLTTIRMIAETSPQGIDREATHIVLDETLRMQHLVEDLLTLAKVDDDGLLTTHHDVDLDDLVQRECSRLRASKTVNVRATLEPVRVTGDEQRLAQAIRNLTDNAARHASASVRLTCRIESGWARLDIDNDGPLIDVQDRTRIFDRFVRLDAARVRDAGGSGLGLAIVHAIILAHHGTVEVDETLDGWCRFTIRLPWDAQD